MIDSEAKRRWLLFGVCCALVALPYLVVRFPPATDLPQHVAQVRLFFDQLRHPSDAYRIQLTTPYNLGYVLIAAFYLALGPLAAGRAALLTVALAWTAAIHYLAMRRGRPAASAVLATVFVFNFAFYWGFYTFVFGFPIFLVWVVLTTKPDGEVAGLSHGLKLVATALALYFSHAFWLAAALGWLAVSLVVLRPSRRTVAMRVGAVAPVAVIAAAWYASFSKTWYTSGVETLPGNWGEKLYVQWWVDSALGGLIGTTETIVVLVTLLWLAVALWRHRRGFGAAVDMPLAACALMFTVVAIVGPYNYQNTVFFGERWVPLAFILGILAAPLPLPRAREAQAAAVGILAALCLSTALLWTRFAALEETGFEAAVEAVPPGVRLLGLDFVKDSAVVKVYPFMQMAAYAQALHGGTLGFSFAEFPQSLVVYNVDGRFRPPWTPRLEWWADKAKPSDFQYFDYALINADDAVHRRLPDRFPLTPVTAEGRWRLYKVRDGA